MKRAVLALALFTVSCSGGNQASPVAPTIIREYITVGPSASPPPPPGPHFALELQAMNQTTFEGDPWNGRVSVIAGQHIISPELPARVVTTCGSEIRTHPLGSGTVPFSCLLPVGSHSIGAVAEMGDGRRFPTAITARVLARPVPPTTALAVSVQARTQGTPAVVVHHFTVNDVGAYRYRWSFDDRTFDTTLAPNVTHGYSANGEYRAEVTAVDTAGRTIGFGSVVAVVNHHDED